MCLYGHEIDETTTPLEAGLGWITKLDKGDFLGRDVIARQKEQGLTRRLVGFEMSDKLIAREHHSILDPGNGPDPIGHVTSGGPAPFLKKNIGMAYGRDEREAADHGEGGADAVLQATKVAAGFTAETQEHVREEAAKARRNSDGPPAEPRHPPGRGQTRNRQPGQTASRRPTSRNRGKRCIRRTSATPKNMSG